MKSKFGGAQGFRYQNQSKQSLSFSKAQFSSGSYPNRNISLGRELSNSSEPRRHSESILVPLAKTKSAAPFPDESRVIGLAGSGPKRAALNYIAVQLPTATWGDVYFDFEPHLLRKARIKAPCPDYQTIWGWTLCSRSASVVGLFFLLRFSRYIALSALAMRFCKVS